MAEDFEDDFDDFEKEEQDEPMNDEPAPAPMPKKRPKAMPVKKAVPVPEPEPEAEVYEEPMEEAPAPAAPMRRAAAPQTAPAHGQTQAPKLPGAAVPKKIQKYIPFILPKRIGVLDETGEPLLEDEDLDKVLLALLVKVLNEVDDIKKRL